MTERAIGKHIGDEIAERSEAVSRRRGEKRGVVELEDGDELLQQINVGQQQRVEHIKDIRTATKRAH